MSSSVWKIALAPLSMIYGTASYLRREAYRAGYLPVHHLSVPVVSVGGLSVGGCGKTPVTRWIAEYLKQQGFRVGVVHGGYGGSQRAWSCRVDFSQRFMPYAAKRYGDEAVLLAGWLKEAIVICGQDKVEAAKLAVRHGAQIIVVDDGFQHRQLHRDVDILLGDEQPCTLPLPAGRGREFHFVGHRAHLIWIHGRSGVMPSRSDGDLYSLSVPTELYDNHGLRLGNAADLDGKRVVLLCGIANPRAFSQLVRNLGAKIMDEIFVGDHQRFSSRNVHRAMKMRPELVLCTEKDAARMAGDPLAASLVALGQRVEVLRGAEKLQRHLSRILSNLEGDGAI